MCVHVYTCVCAMMVCGCVYVCVCDGGVWLCVCVCMGAGCVHMCDQTAHPRALAYGTGTTGEDCLGYTYRPTTGHVVAKEPWPGKLTRSNLSGFSLRQSTVPYHAITTHTESLVRCHCHDTIVIADVIAAGKPVATASLHRCLLRCHQHC